MKILTSLPNIGKTLATKLRAIGITEAKGLMESGRENTIIRISMLDNGGVCINMLYALEGAVQGIRWHNLSSDRKSRASGIFYQLHRK